METQDSFSAARFGTTPQGSERVYRVRRELVTSALVFSVTLGVLTPLLVLFMGTSVLSISGNTFIFVIFCLVGLIAFGIAITRYWASTVPELRILPAGIYYRDYGFTIRTAWANVEQIGSVFTGRVRVGGLLLNSGAAPDTRINGLLKALLILKPIVFLLSLIYGFAGPVNQKLTRVIPVGKFQTDWENNELGQQINQYAPWLFDPNFRPGEYPAPGSQRFSPRNWQAAAPVAPAKIPPARLLAVILLLFNLAAFSVLWFILKMA